MTDEVKGNSRRTFFIAVLTIMFIVFVGRLLQLQFLYQEEYGKKSEENSIRPIARDPIRGYMYDRNGALIVDNRPSYTLTITPAEFQMETIDYLARVLQLDPEFIRERIKKGKVYNRFAPVKIKRDIDFQTLSAIEENRSKLPGIDYQIESKRYYPTSAKATHLFGYTKEVSDQQVADHPNDYRPGDIIGASGVEGKYDQYLRGHKGFEFITVNARGEMLGAYNDGRNDIPVTEGSDLTLALDMKLQAFAESLMAGKTGAVVALDPNDGGILALVSEPDYDLTLFGSGTSYEAWNNLNTDPMKPLFNRATLTRYPPGSTFKMVLAAAALEDGVINSNWTITCTGSYQFGNRAFKDHIPHGVTNLVESIQRSCNVYYYQLMLKTGFTRWTSYGGEFGFGSPTGIDIGEENPGLLPSDEYFDRVYGKGKWTQGYLISLAIGQGELGVSPLQMACYAGALASRGNYFRPHVVQRIRDKKSGEMLTIAPESRKIELSAQVWNVLQEGMKRVVNAPGGTGGAARVPGIVVAGKTGTSQNQHGKKDHAWFIGYAPADHPKIAICVLVENAGFGGTVSAPIAGMCIEKYLYGNLIRTTAPRLEQLMAAPQDSTAD
jgi:penicillin-binding protein 2